MKNLSIALVLMLLFTSTIAVWSLSVSATIGSPITAHLATNPVTIDGQWTSSSEWSDAAEVQFLVAQGSTPAYFRLKHDANFLYVLSESPDPGLEYSDATQHADQLFFLIDPLSNGGSAPQSDDYQFLLGGPNASHTNIFMFRGDGTGWVNSCGIDVCTPPFPVAGFDGKLGLDNGNSPHAPYPHVVGELKIHLTITSSTSFNIFIRMIDSSEAMSLWFYWPGPTNPPDLPQARVPDTWGQVMISSTPIPEFPAGWLTSAMIVALTATLIVTQRKQTPARTS